MDKRQEHIQKIRKAKAELKTAGKIHRKDLIRYIHRLEKELATYDRLGGGHHWQERTI
jgi:hypothetical protein